MYTAQIVEQSLDQGLLRVTVRFDIDGGGSFTEVFETRQAQGDDWIEEQIRRKLKDVNALPALKDKIQLKQGAIIEITAEEILESATPTEREVYAKDLADFERYVNALTRGITVEENPNFGALKQRLIANFKDEYIDMF